MGERYDVLIVGGGVIGSAIARELDIPSIRCGKVLVGDTEEERQRLLVTIEQGKVNGASGLRMVEGEELRQLVPASVNKFAMFSENSGVGDPFIYTIALAENAVMNGAEYFLGHEVTGIR